jgi:micrococcal nuclease
MTVIKFKPRRSWSRRTRALGIARARIVKYFVGLSALVVLCIASLWQLSIDANLPVPVSDPSIFVVDGDTVRANSRTYRLVGFDTPESGTLARCERERTLADTATSRLRELIANGQTTLERVPCSCPPGTEGTRDCNHGRLCARLQAGGRDVGPILISEGLARPYVCGRNGCPKRQSWCG